MTGFCVFLPHRNCREIILRFVFSYLQVNWHDFAFFDPVMYESLRQLIRHSQTEEAEAVFAAMDLAFAIDLCKEEGSGQVTAAFFHRVAIRAQCAHMTERFLLDLQVELLAGGVNMPVTPLNVYEYVRRYAEHRMLVVAEQPLHVSDLHFYFLEARL